jgi:hypothetical protein
MSIFRRNCLRRLWEDTGRNMVLFVYTAFLLLLLFLCFLENIIFEPERKNLPPRM